MLNRGMNKAAMIDLKTAGTSSLSIPGLGSGQSGSYSKHGNEDQGTNCATIDICPDLLFGGIFAAGAAAFAALYIAITMAAMKRKRREAKDSFVKNENNYNQFSLVQDIFYAGMFKVPINLPSNYTVHLKAVFLCASFIDNIRPFSNIFFSLQNLYAFVDSNYICHSIK